MKDLATMWCWGAKALKQTEKGGSNESDEISLYGSGCAAAAALRARLPGPWAKTEGGLRIVYCILNIDWGKMSWKSSHHYSKQIVDEWWSWAGKLNRALQSGLQQQLLDISIGVRNSNTSFSANNKKIITKMSDYRTS